MYRKLLLALLFLPCFAQAADITATTGWTCTDTLPASMTIDSGSNRQLVIMGVDEINTVTMDIVSVGTISETETFTYEETSTGADSHFTVWIWNESAIASMSGTTISGTDGGANWCLGVIDDADQAALGSFTGTAVDLSANDITVTTTSSAGDYILGGFMRLTLVSGTFTTFDTLTEIGDFPTGSNDTSFAGGDGGDNATLAVHDTASAGEMSAAAVVFLDFAAGAPSFDVSPTVTATTATTYTIGYTPNQTTTFYTVACNPGETVPVCSEIKTGDCGTNAAEADANEAVTGADTTQMTGISFPRHDIYSCLSDGGGDSSVVTLADENRATDTAQTIVVTTSISSTSPFALGTDSTGDTTSGDPQITGMTDTTFFQVGMLVDLSAGFSGNPRFITALTSTTMTLDEDATSTQSNITTTADVYYVPTAAAGDVIEHDDDNSEGDAVTWAVDGDVSYTDTCGGCLTTIDYCIQDVSDLTGEYTNPACWTTDDKIYIFNTAPTCSDVGEPATLVLDYNVLMTPVDFSVLCSDVDLHTITYTVWDGTLPTGLSLSTAGILSGTPTVEDEGGAAIRILATDVGGLVDSIDDRIIYVVDTVTMPTLTSGDLTASLAAELASFPWRDAPEQTATFECDRTEADQQVLAQTPTASTEVAADVAITVDVASDGLCMLLRRRHQ